MIKIEDLKTFKIRKTFKYNKETVNGLNFHPYGDALITSSDDDFILIYDCLNKNIKPSKILCKKYGVSQILYTKSIDRAIHSSTKLDSKLITLIIFNYKTF